MHTINLGVIPQEAGEEASPIVFQLTPCPIWLP